MKTLQDYTGQSARQAVDDAIAAAEAHASYNALIALTAERARERADAVDRGEITGRLAGVPFIAKDNFLSFGAPTTAASAMLKTFSAPIQATAIEKLEAEGAICIGKANLDAFAHGGSTENSAFGVTKNAHDETRVAGGSSGGSAAAVALSIVPFALGTDTGGSIRQPASFNGVVGMKPTYGTVSRFGVVAMASSTDTIGVLASNVEDASLVMEIIAGKDSRDMTTLEDFLQPVETPGGLKIGLVQEAMGEGVDDSVRAATEAYAERLRNAGHTVETVSLPLLHYALAMYYIIVPAEISSNLARYDGVRYGLRAQVPTLQELYGKSREAGFMPENKRRIMLGSYVLSSGFYDAYYLKAQKARTLLIQQFNNLFETYDMLLLPTAPSVAFAIGERTDDPLHMYAADIMTVPASLAGLPALSVPAGTDQRGMPIGVQLIGPRKADAQLLALAQSVEGDV